MANSATVGILRVLLTADTAELTTGLEKSAGSLKKWQKEFEGVGKQLSALFGGDAVKVLSGFGVAVSGVMATAAAAGLKYASALDEARDRTGATVEGLQELRYAAAKTGTSFDSVLGAMESLQTRLGRKNAGLIGAFAELGLNFAEISRLPVDQAFFAIQKGLQTVESEADRARLATAIFGGAWRDAADVVMSDSQQMAEDTIRMSEQQVDALERAGKAIVGFARTTTDQVLTFTGKALADAWRGLERGAEVVTFAWARMTGDVEEANRIVREAMQRDGKLTAEAIEKNLVAPTRDYGEELKQAQRDVKALTAEQRENIRAAVALGESTKDVAAAVDVTEQAVKLYVEQVKKADTEHKRTTEQAKRDTEKVEKAWAEWRAMIAGMAARDLPNFADEYVRQTRKMLDANVLVSQGLSGMGFEVRKLGTSLDEGELDMEAYKEGVRKHLGLAGEKVVSFKDTVKAAFTDINGIVTGTLQAMVDDFFDKFGILGDILSGFVNNAIKWIADWAFGLLGWGKTATNQAAEVVDAMGQAAKATQAAASVALASIASWVSLGGVIAAVGFGVTKLLEAIFPTTPVTLPRTPDPVLDDPSRRGTDPSEPTFPRLRGIGTEFAVGGIVTAPTQAIIGEAGAEAVIPLDRLPGLLQQMRGGGSTVNNYFNAMDSLSFREWWARTGMHEFLRSFEQNDSGGAPVSGLTRLRTITA